MDSSDGVTTRRETLLTHTLVRLADTLIDHFDVVDLLTLVSERCVEALDVSAAGILLAYAEDDLRVIASSSQAMHVVESFELQAEEGPCLDCYRSGIPVVNLDLSTAGHCWPRFATYAVEAGFRSVHAFPLRLRGSTIGALNLFRNGIGDMDDDDTRVAQAFADVATIAILQNRASIKAQVLNEQLQSALNSRIKIEQAKGVLAERLNLNMEEAFNRLRNYARNQNMRLAEVASAVTGGTLAIAVLENDPFDKKSYDRTTT